MHQLANSKLSAAGSIANSWLKDVYYQLSLVENARRFREIGGEQFMREEVLKWTCPACGGAISQHDRICTVCGKGMGLKDEK